MNTSQRPTTHDALLAAATQRRRAQRRADGWIACTDIWAAEDTPIGPTGAEALG